MYLSWLNDVRQGLFPKEKMSGWYKNFEFGMDAFAALGVCLAQVTTALLQFGYIFQHFVQADKLIMTKFTYAELEMRRILSPGLEYAAGKSEAVGTMRLSASLHQDRWPEVSMTSFLFNQAELHRKALARSCPQDQGVPPVPQTPAELTLNLREFEEHFSNPSLTLEHHSSNGEGGTQGGDEEDAGFD